MSGKKPTLRQSTKILVVLGSGISINAGPAADMFASLNLPFMKVGKTSSLAGGHTAEMLTLLQKLNGKEGSTRSYVVAATDQLSAQKAQRYEEGLLQTISTTKSVRKSKLPLSLCFQ